MFEELLAKIARHLTNAGIRYMVIDGRPRDLDDVKKMAIKNPGIDSNYVRTWLDWFSTDLAEPFMAYFDQLLREAGSEVRS